MNRNKPPDRDRMNGERSTQLTVWQVLRGLAAAPELRLLFVVWLYLLAGALFGFGLGAAAGARIWVRLVGSIFVLATFRRLRQIDPTEFENFERGLQQRRIRNQRGVLPGKWSVVALAAAAAIIIALPSLF